MVFGFVFLHPSSIASLPLHQNLQFLHSPFELIDVVNPISDNRCAISLFGIWDQLFQCIILAPHLLPPMFLSSKMFSIFPITFPTTKLQNTIPFIQMMMVTLFSPLHLHLHFPENRPATA
ncbi:hypothetical protein HanPSC8_Chr17g0788911 [Helianthus annuus]|nr:hypothetical protein HanPSC8_Chr17g0788911 [Helianthus annuus]